MKILNLYFVRHGQTEWNLQDRLQGAKNSKLTPKGIKDAKLTGRHLHNINFNTAYSSPQPRAIETRNHILANINNSNNTINKIIPDLTEMDYGDWEGLYINELKKIEEFNVFLNDATAFNNSINQGESYQDVFKRGVNAIEQIINNAKHNENILIVSHGNFLRLILCHLNGGNWQKHRDNTYFPKISNASISIANCEINPSTFEKKFKFTMLNNIDHLNELR